MTTRKSIQDAFSLQYFIHRAKVFKLYRSFLRAASPKYLDIINSNYILIQIKEDFRRHRNIADKVAIKGLIVEAERHLRMLNDLKSQSLSLTKKLDVDSSHKSWLQSGDKWDERGRVGTKWPWENVFLTDVLPYDDLSPSKRFQGLIETEKCLRLYVSIKIVQIFAIL
eukprot:gene4125-5879_t